MLTAKSPVNRILLIKFRGIGDVILSTVVLKNLKARYPDAAIDFLTEKPSAPLLGHRVDKRRDRIRWNPWNRTFQKDNADKTTEV